MPNTKRKAETKRWDSHSIFPEELPPVVTLEAAIPDLARDDLNYMCGLLHAAVDILDERGPLTIIQLCRALNMTATEFRSVWATFYLGGYEALRQEALRPTFHRVPNDPATSR